MHFATKQKKTDPQNGIDISTPHQQERKATIAAICSQVLLILFAVFGVTYSFIGSFSLNVLSATIAAYLLLFVLIFVLAFSVKKWTKFILPSVFLLFCAAGWYFFHDIVQGFILTANSILASFTAHSDWVFDIYDVETATAQQHTQMATVFLLFVLFAITGIVSSAIMQSKSFFSVFFITFPFILAPLIFTITPPLLPLLLLSTCWVALAVQKISTHEVKKRKKSQKKADLSETQHDESAHQLNYFSMVSVALCFALILCIFPQSSYVRDQNADDARAKLQDFAQQGDLFSAWQTGGINGGNLKSSNNISFTGETVLKIKTDSTTPLYLRAFAGSTYTGDRWEPISDAIYNQYSAAFSTLDGKSFNPQNLTEKYMEISNSVTSGTTLDPQYEITVQNVHANKRYVYAPYALITTPAELPGSVFVNDGYMKADSWFGLSSYSLKAYYLHSINYFTNFLLSSNADIQNYYKIDYRNANVAVAPKLIQEYLNVEYAYRDFLYDYNTALPDDIKKKVIKLCADNQLSKNNLAEDINAVQAYLAKTCQYTLSPGKTPANRDFTDYFLFENHKGYCVHFATAATILLRALGIPARYVEGYVANNSDLTTLDSDGYASIKDSRAHAWTEVYVPTYGWVPVEMTPGFYKEDSSNLSPKAGEEPTPSQSEENGTKSSTAPQSKPTVTSQPQSNLSESSVPSSSSKGVIGGADSSTNTVTHGPISPLFPFVFFLILLIALLAIVYGNRQYAIRWRKQNFHLQNTNESTLAIYAYLLKVFAFLGYKYERTVSLHDYAKQAAQKLPVLHDNEFEGITQIAQRARFSQHKITDKELAYMNTFVQNLIDPIYSTLPRHKKLLFRYWHRLN